MTLQHSLRPLPAPLGTLSLQHWVTAEVRREMGGWKETTSVSSKLSVFLSAQIEVDTMQIVAISPLGSTTESSRVRLQGTALIRTADSVCVGLRHLCASTMQEVTTFERFTKDSYPAADQEFCLWVGGLISVIWLLSPFCHCLTHQELLRSGLLFKSLLVTHIYQNINTDVLY